MGLSKKVIAEMEYISVKSRTEFFSKKKEIPDRKEDSVFFRSNMLNVGRCGKDSLIKLTYQLVNRSKKSILIGQVTGSCGCLSFDYDKGAIFPDEESPLTVQFRSGATGGFFKKEIYVQLKSGKRFTLWFYVNVVE